jgi:hypothetical protein
VKHGWENEDVYSEISSEHKWTKNLMITKFPNTISSGKILLPLSFLFLVLDVQCRCLAPKVQKKFDEEIRELFIMNR